MQKTIQQELEESIQDYGYFNGWRDPEKLAGRSSEMIEYMAVLPKPGKKKQLVDAAKKLNIFLNKSQKSFDDGQPKQEVLTFISSNQPQFKQMVREIVKSRIK